MGQCRSVSDVWQASQVVVIIVFCLRVAVTDLVPVSNNESSLKYQTSGAFVHRVMVKCDHTSAVVDIAGVLECLCAFCRRSGRCCRVTPTSVRLDLNCTALHVQSNLVCPFRSIPPQVSPRRRFVLFRNWEFLRYGFDTGARLCSGCVDMASILRTHHC